MMIIAQQCAARLARSIYTAPLYSYNIFDSEERVDRCLLVAE